MKNSKLLELAYCKRTLRNGLDVPKQYFVGS